MPDGDAVWREAASALWRVARQDALMRQAASQLPRAAKRHVPVLDVPLPSDAVLEELEAIRVSPPPAPPDTHGVKRDSSPAYRIAKAIHEHGKAYREPGDDALCEALAARARAASAEASDG